MAANNLYQYSILSALMGGICGTGITVEEILKNGDHGLGTVSNLNGEIVIIDGEAYHFPPGEELRKVEFSDVLPFAMVTRFKPTMEKSLRFLTFNSLPEALETLLPSRQNCFLSIRVDGLFDHLRFRVIAAQSKPRESLAESVRRQKVLTHRDIEGTLFGFWSPAFSGGFSVPGFHLHFLSKSKDRGGHVLEFDSRGARLQAAVLSEYTVKLPQNKDFNEEVIGSVGGADLSAAEK
ncbi:Alpha-acetolactate decarboxylase [Penicillium concentricum]|uniref:Alpha-acetolactate decarboxylase n=1 Tax=Penicillium concentricum TaxID=293559 RepID=A0A9W9RAZ2_9EURO|nr:Alpha-acetolactate decarboxylase [Penicillium concentricum]KAJ5356793.1 Alpha-acetolactate decarboxylase [Penicillium concentricum]